MLASGWGALAASATAVPATLQLTRADGHSVPAMFYAPTGNCQGVALISHGAGGSEKGYGYLALAQWGFLALGVIPT